MLSFAPFVRLPVQAALAFTCALSTPALAAPAPAAAATAPNPGDLPLAPGEGRKVALELATQLESDFILPANGRDYAAMLRANAATGKYDDGTRGALAKRMNDDLMAVHKDGHLAVRVSEPPRERGHTGLSAPLVQSAKTIAPGIGYIRFTAFFGTDEEMQQVRDWLAANKDAKTLIFDLRNHHGGGLDEQDLIFSKLFATRQPLVRMEMAKAVFDENGAPTGENPNLRFAPKGRMVEAIHYSAPDATSTLTRANVYLLTSNRSASAAEHFALALKSTGRATLLGEPTAGANHFGGGSELTEHFNVWLPIGRTSDVKTGQDWEGAGIAPDIAVDPKLALVVALEKAGLSHAEAVRLDALEVPAEPVHSDKLRAR